MSNNNTVFEYDPTYAGVEPEVLPETPVEENPIVEEQPQPKKKNAAARVFAAIFTLAAIACILLPCAVAQDTGLAAGSLLNVLLSTIGGSNKLMGILPTIASDSTVLGQLSGVSVYVAALSLVLAVVCGVVAIFSTKNAPCRLRATVYFLTLGLSVLSVCNFLYAYKLTGDFMKSFTELMYPVIAMAAALVVYFVLACAKVGKKAWVNLLQSVLALAAVCALAFFVAANATVMDKFFNGLGMTSMASTLTLMVYAVLIVGMALAILRLTARKNNAWDLVRYIVVLLVAAALVYAAFTGGAEQTALIVAIAAAVATVLNILVWAMSKGCKKCKKEKKEKKVKEKAEKAVEAPAPAPVEEYIREEYAEALPYEGGPVEGVEIAQEVNPTYVAPPAEVQTAGYDFYNCKSFDPFIAILNNEERNQFTELFILKYKGVMPELPDYEVGGDNKNFFRKLFIYLGQYRDRIPDGLLTKIYQYAVRM